MKFHDKYDIIKIYGLTQDPITKEYIFVMQYMKNGSLQNYLTKDFKNFKWKDKIEILFQCWHLAAAKQFFGRLATAIWQKRPKRPKNCYTT